MLKTNNKSRLSLRLRPLALAVGAVLFSGCAVNLQPMTEADQQARVSKDMSEIFAQQEPLKGPLTLADAIARSIKYNLDHKLKMMESALAERKLDVSKYDMLPNLAARAGYSGRNNESGASSQSLLSGIQSLEPSTSQERNTNTTSLGVSWNVLDFGVSYVRAKQEADRVLISKERKRKVMQNIVQDVRSAYWRAVAAQRLLKRIDPLLEKVQKARADSRKVEEMRLQSPLQALNYQRTLLEAMRQLQSLRGELVGAKVQLAALINVPPGSDFQLTAPEKLEAPKLVELDLKAMEDAALLHRPELVEEGYQSRISAEETRKAMLRMLPGIEFNYSTNYDSNSYLYNNQWQQYGVQVSWNLLNIFSGPDNMKMAEAREEVGHTKRLALNMAVLTQVNLAWQRYHQAAKQLQTTSELADIENRIRDQLENAGKNQRQGELEVIRGELNAVIAQLRKNMAYSELQNALGRLYVSIGADPMPDKVDSYSVQDLSKGIKTVMDKWQHGEVGTDSANVPG